MKNRYSTFILGTVIGISLVGCGDGESSASALKVALGESLYHDTSLSLNKTMSCATCHTLNEGLIDPRSTSKTLGASLGDDGTSIGDRNAPTAGYASFSPDFHFDTGEGLFIGGQFLDGRSSDLKEQAKGPFLNPIEMGMPSISSVLERVRENASYISQFQTLYGSDIFDDETKAYDALADAIAAFEKSGEFAVFDSKYDRFLAGSYTLSAEEARGLALFVDENPGGAMCSACHPAVSADNKPLFTDFSYDNLGVPVNHALRTANGQAGNADLGLFANPEVNDTDLRGAFKVSSLRNIAVTGPYMHNGLFKDLKTVVHFYNTRDLGGAINPETNATWETGEFHALRNVDELGNLGLSDQDEDDIVAFLKTLTDQRYEHLIP
jgi:cytochrome c peroxidase